MPDFFDPQVFGRVQNLALRSKRMVESYMTGMHKSKLRGISTEFAQHRQYVPGDDTKHLDWKVYAKTDRFYVKEYEAETNLAMRMLIDTSKSMFFKSEEATMSKFEYAATLAATLAYLLMQQKDTFGLALFDDEVRTVMPTKGSGSHFRNIVNVLETASPGEQTDVSQALMMIAPQIKQRGLVVIISDFVGDTDRLALGLGQLTFTGQDVLLFHIEDPMERDFPFTGQTIFVGMEKEGEMLCDPRDLRGAYLRERQRHLDEIKSAAQRFGYTLDHCATDNRLDNVLSSILMTRLAGVGRF